MSAQLKYQPNLEIKPQVLPFFDAPTNSFSYIVKDPESKACAVIDSVMNLDYPSGTISYSGADDIVNYIQTHQLELQWLIETHVHADHLSASAYIQEKLGGKLIIGEKITVVQKLFGEVFNAEKEFKRDGSQFDCLLKDGDSYQIGGMTAFAMHTPGHTPACMTHVIGNAAFVGDTLFMPDAGSARADFPGGDPRILFQSIKKVLSLSAQTRLFMCHDYGPNDRAIEYETSVEKEVLENIHVHHGVTEDQFVKMRNARDISLGMPQLILPALQVNMRAGHLPAAEDNNMIYLKLPINAFTTPE